MACSRNHLAWWWALLPLSLPLAAGELHGEATFLGNCQTENARLSARVRELEALTATNARLSARVQELEALAATSEVTPAPTCPRCTEADELEAWGSPDWYRTVFLAFFCVVLAALAAGLTMGLVSLDPMEMEIIANAHESDVISEASKKRLVEDKESAARVHPLISNHHRLLVTLLLMNSLANEALPLFLDALVPSWLAVILSVTLVLMFGEIIPSAIFTGSNQLKISAKFACIVRACQILLSPIAVPIAWVLDRCLGEDHKGRYNFAELRAVVSIHSKAMHDEGIEPVFKSVDIRSGIITTEQDHHFDSGTLVSFEGESTKLHAGSTYYVEPCDPPDGSYNKGKTFRLYEDESEESQIMFKKTELTSGVFKIEHRDEIKIMQNLMEMTHLTAEQCQMVRLRDVAMLDANKKLDYETLSKGHSRLPVYEDTKHNVRGFILVKKLIEPLSKGAQSAAAENMEKTLNEMIKGNDKFEQCDLVAIRPTMKLLDLLRLFQREKRHLALITSEPETLKACWQEKRQVPEDVWMKGIITLEDVIEKLVGGIDDEQDAEREQSKDKDLSKDKEKMRQTMSRALTMQRQPSGSFDKGSKRSSERKSSRGASTGLKQPLLNEAS